MQVCNLNDVKIYNLNAGKSLPDWLSDRKKRTLQSSDNDVRQRIEIMQDFDMPTVSNCIQLSRNGQYIFATGVYKPRVRCYDVEQLSLKFERCMDSEVLKFCVLSDDYSKLVFLQNDRYVEFHVQHGRWYRTRLPKYGRDLAYNSSTCDMYFVGAGSEVFRLNLELGTFLKPLKSDSEEMLCCQFNDSHQLFAYGTIDGCIECWDPRSRTRVGKLQCATHLSSKGFQRQSIPSISCLKYRDSLTLGCGTSTGQILLYDLRSSLPILIKDHNFDLPIRNLDYQHDQQLVFSQDQRILKIWNWHTGSPYTSIEPGTKLNDLCLVPNSGLVLMATEAPKMLMYYIPSVGTAPRWCSFLDSLTEELEEDPNPAVYEDYKFVTRSELDSLGLTHLIGSNLLRAYLHGYFMDVRLYHKAKSVADPFIFENYKQQKIKERLTVQRFNRVKLMSKLPSVNKVLAEKLAAQQGADFKQSKLKKKAGSALDLLQDERFSKLFENPDFQVDINSEDYRLLNPLVSKLEKTASNRQKRQTAVQQQFTEIQDEPEGQPSEDESEDESISSDDDDKSWVKEVQQQHRLLKDRRKREYDESKLKTKFFESKGSELQIIPSDVPVTKKPRAERKSLGDRLNEQEKAISRTSNFGNAQLTFMLDKSKKEKHWQHQSYQHHRERQKLRRSAADISLKTSKFWKSKHI